MTKEQEPKQDKPEEETSFTVEVKLNTWGGCSLQKSSFGETRENQWYRKRRRSANGIQA